MPQHEFTPPPVPWTPSRLTKGRNDSDPICRT